METFLGDFMIRCHLKREICKVFAERKIVECLLNTVTIVQLSNIKNKNVNHLIAYTGKVLHFQLDPINKQKKKVHKR